MSCIEPTDGGGRTVQLLYSPINGKGNWGTTVEQWEGIVCRTFADAYAVVDEEGNTIRAERDLLELKKALKTRFQASLEQVRK